MNELKIKPSEQVEHILNTLLNKVIDGQIENRKDLLLKEIHNLT
jgi:hypothetical protein